VEVTEQERRLREVLQAPPGGAPPPVDMGRVRRRAALLRRRRGLAVAGALTVLAAAAVGGPLLAARDAHQPTGPAILAPAPPATATAAAVTATGQAPDLAVVRADGLHVTMAGEDRLLPSTVGATYPAWSPDGAWLAWLQGGSLWRLSVTGGDAARVGAATALAWSAQGVLAGTGDALLLSGSQSVRTVPAGTAEGRPVWDGSGRKLALSTLAGIQVVPVLGDAARPVEGDGAATLHSAGRCSRPAAWLADALLVWRDTVMCSASIASDGLPLAWVDVGSDRVTETGPTALTHPDWVRALPDRVLAIGGGDRVAGNDKHETVAGADHAFRTDKVLRSTSVISLAVSGAGRQAQVLVPSSRDVTSAGPGGSLALDAAPGSPALGPPAARAVVWADMNRLLVLAGADTERLRLWEVDAAEAGGNAYQPKDLGEISTPPDAYYAWFPLEQVAASRPAIGPAPTPAPSPSPSAQADSPAAPAAPGGAADAATATAAPAGPLTTATGDLDGDGRLDRVVLDTKTSTLTALLADGRRLSTHQPELGTGVQAAGRRVAGVSDLFGTGRGVVLVASSAGGCCGYRFDRGELTAYALGAAGLVPLLTPSQGALRLSVEGGQGESFGGFACAAGSVVITTAAHAGGAPPDTFLVTRRQLHLGADGRAEAIPATGSAPTTTADRMTARARTAVSCPGLAADGFAQRGG